MIISGKGVLPVKQVKVSGFVAHKILSRSFQYVVGGHDNTPEFCPVSEQRVVGSRGSPIVINNDILNNITLEQVGIGKMAMQGDVAGQVVDGLAAVWVAGVVVTDYVSIGTGFYHHGMTQMAENIVFDKALAAMVGKGNAISAGACPIVLKGMMKIGARNLNPQTFGNVNMTAIAGVAFNTRNPAVSRLVEVDVVASPVYWFIKSF